jgi:hypothetical protein
MAARTMLNTILRDATKRPLLRMTVPLPQLASAYARTAASRGTVAKPALLA